MSLTTTMGIELTYVPAMYQVALNRGATFEPEYAPMESDVNCALARLMQHLIRAKKIPVWGEATTDPGCVEIRTKPYRKLSTLLSIARRLRREAEELGLVVQADYSSGGGAHIHTGIIGSDNKERSMYSKRMMLFAAMNPWLAWATLNTVDDINAKPLTRQHLSRRNRYSDNNDEDTVEHCESHIKSYAHVVARETAYMHRADRWCERVYRERGARDVLAAQTYLMMWKMRLIRLRSKSAKAETDMLSVESIQYTGDKDDMVRITDYGDNGTIEFRCFEMGGEDKLKRNIILANAICNYVEKWDITEYNSNDVMSGEQMRAIKWSEAKRGWLNMLAMLGLDPADYRNETAQIAHRWRYSMRDYNQHPTAVDVLGALQQRTTDGREQADLAEHEARLAAEQVARARARYERRQNRRAPRPSAIAPEVDPYSLAA